MKSLTKKHLTEIMREKRKTGGGQSSAVPLSEIEELIASRASCK
jgi:hypothetical protein